MKFNCDTQNAQSWEIRAEKAVQILANSDFIKNNRQDELKIADFGCGNEKLRSILTTKLEKIKFDYYGYDLEPQLETTFKINLEREMPSLHFDVVFCLGLLEYLYDLDLFLLRVSQISKFLIISYVFSNSGCYSHQHISQKGWLHHYSALDLETKFEKYNYGKQDFKITNNGKTGLWMLQNEI